ncbi:MAG: NAD(P)-dependent oxidoreductase [Candidatus Vogelbacteria bacterium]|nr:NAD(P)-dependent oxidoreductase [Candidatus Vogelbacteria bacterium]
MNILITGGAGYVGYSVVEVLAKKYPNSKIIIYDNFSKGRLENISLLVGKYKNIEIIPWENADIRDADKFESALIEFKPEIVVHLAAIVDAFTTNREGKDAECEIVNHVAAVSIAKLCKTRNVRVFIYQSTVSMYSRGEELTEDSPKEPLSVYGSSKLKAEEEILAMHDNDFRTCALRSATIVGFNPSFRYETIINLVCIRSVYGMKTTIFESALHNPKTYLSLKDESAAVVFLIDNIDKVNGQAYNATSFSTDLANIINLIEENGIAPSIVLGGEKKVNQQVYTINSDRIKKIGFSSQSSPEEIVKDVLNGVKKRKELNEALL